MFRIFAFLVVVFLVIGFIACTGEKKEETVKTEAQVEETVTAGMIDCDADCGMKMEESKMITYVHESDTLHFCSDKCKENYMAKEEPKEETKKES